MVEVNVMYEAWGKGGRWEVGWEVSEQELFSRQKVKVRRWIKVASWKCTTYVSFEIFEF